MPKYIDIEKEINEMEKVLKEHKNDTRIGSDFALGAFRLFINELKQVPAEDVVPVVHAHWIDYNGKLVESDSNGFPKDSCWCSHCHEWLVASDEYSVFGRYCPNCGARMDEDNNNDKN